VTRPALPPISRGYDGYRPYTWREWHNADYYIERLILEE